MTLGGVTRREKTVPQVFPRRLGGDLRGYVWVDGHCAARLVVPLRSEFVGAKNKMGDSNSNVVSQLLERDEVCVSEHASGVAEEAGGEFARRTERSAAVKTQLVLGKPRADAVGAVAEYSGDHWLAPLKLLGRRVEEPHALGVWD